MRGEDQLGGLERIRKVSGDNRCPAALCDNGIDGGQGVCALVAIMNSNREASARTGQSQNSSKSTARAGDESDTSVRFRSGQSKRPNSNALNAKKAPMKTAITPIASIVWLRALVTTTL